MYLSMRGVSSIAKGGIQISGDWIKSLRLRCVTFRRNILLTYVYAQLGALNRGVPLGLWDGLRQRFLPHRSLIAVV